MSSAHQSIRDIDVVNAPWNKEITVQEVEYEGGFKMLRLRIKEGKRFTDLELDGDTANTLAHHLSQWAGARAGD